MLFMSSKYDVFCIKLKNFFAFRKHISLNNEEKMAIRKNIKWKGKYEGKRCFIVGNGPSLRKQELRKIHNEYVFTVNQMMKSELYQDLNSDFHVIADPLYFDINPNKEEHKVVINTIKKINYLNKKPECFFPVSVKKEVNRLGLSDLNINYFFPTLSTYDGMNPKINLQKGVYIYNTVTQYAIQIAIYMGFKEIYLLGCDMTGYKEVEQFANNSFSEQTHVYTESEEDMKKALHKERSCEQWFVGFGKMFTDYRRLYEYCQKKNIKLINLTNGGVLDSLPREIYEKVCIEDI